MNQEVQVHHFDTLTEDVYAAGAAGAYATGASYAAPPPGAIAVNRGGTTYYLSGNTWFKPLYGANGVHYQVVPTP
ncbi:MAG: hypothetical protein U1E63_14865 [Burkholderiales bacterium]